MKPIATAAAVLFLAAGMSGCSTFQNGYERLYQMIDAREQLTRQPAPKASETGQTMSYREYEAERRKIVDPQPAK